MKLLVPLFAPTQHCPACGGRDWDRTRAGVVICIRCAEKEESRVRAGGA
jgi:ribosomal protein L37AE/L43A